MPARTPQEVHTLFVDAFNRSDIEELVALYEPNAIFVSGSVIAKGHDAIREAYQGILAAGGRMELETLTLLDSGDGLGMLHASWTIRGDSFVRVGISTEVVRRQLDGTWLFVIDEPRTAEIS